RLTPVAYFARCFYRLRGLLGVVPPDFSLTGPAATSAGPYFWIGFRPAGPAIAITLQALGSAEGYFHRRRSTLHSTASQRSPGTRSFACRSQAPRMTAVGQHAKYSL